MNNAGDGIPVELFQILKDDAVKVLHSIRQQIWKSQQWPQDWKRSVFIPISKKSNAKNHNKLQKILKVMGRPVLLLCLLTCLYVGQEVTEPDMEQQTVSKLGKEYVKAVYCHSAYLSYMQSISCKILGWMKNKLESRLPGEISITSDMQMIPPFGRK